MEDRELVQIGTSALTLGAWSRVMGGLILLALSAGPAAAKCQDAPSPGADWSGCSKARLVLTGEDLTGTIFQRSLLTLSDFASSKMAGANLSETEVSRTRFERADLSRADFTKALGWRANFGQANLTGTVFVSADMSRSNFAQAKAAGRRHSELHRLEEDLVELHRLRVAGRGHQRLRGQALPLHDRRILLCVLPRAIEGLLRTPGQGK